MKKGDFVVITRGEPHRFYSDRRAEPLRIMDIDGCRHVSASFATAAAPSRSRP